ncbi:heparinase II/III family protein [Gemmatimonadota bacterium]
MRWVRFCWQAARWLGFLRAAKPCHADQNAFTLEAYGEALAIAIGCYPFYRSRHYSESSWETKSSNSIIFDGGIGQVKRNPDSKVRIVSYQAGGDYVYSLADATAAYQGAIANFQRHVVMLKPELFIIRDYLESDTSRTWEWWLHALSEMSLEKNEVTIEKGDSRLSVFF